MTDMTGMTKQEERELAKRLVAEIGRMAETAGRKLRFMEVCGTHTVAIFRAGLRQMLPENVELVSGPGCPVCVTPDDYMDKAMYITPYIGHSLMKCKRKVIYTNCSAHK